MAMPSWKRSNDTFTARIVKLGGVLSPIILTRHVPFSHHRLVHISLNTKIRSIRGAYGMRRVVSHESAARSTRSSNRTPKETNGIRTFVPSPYSPCSGSSSLYFPTAANRGLDRRLDLPDLVHGLLPRKIRHVLDI